MEHDVDDDHLYMAYPSEQNQCCAGMNPAQGFSFQTIMGDEATTRLCHSRVFPTRFKLFKCLQQELPGEKEEEKIHKNTSSLKINSSKWTLVCHLHSRWVLLLRVDLMLKIASFWCSSRRQNDTIGNRLVSSNNVPAASRWKSTSATPDHKNSPSKRARTCWIQLMSVRVKWPHTLRDHVTAPLLHRYQERHE